MIWPRLFVIGVPRDRDRGRGPLAVHFEEFGRPAFKPSLHLSPSSFPAKRLTLREPQDES